ncbi:MAG TPA: PQQ-dependent sugar dehydrogenase [Aggregatilineales bacterium]|nr:PQQ-dependent sugar dehydrogenase [Aggregatilineales bacterium]
MSQRLKIIGFVATALIALVLLFNILREPIREHDAAQAQQQESLSRAQVLYGQNCVQCHGAFGEGLNGNPALNSTAVRFKDASDLFKTIERGRLDTAMIGYGTGEGGTLTNPDIDDLVTLIQHGSWRTVQTYLSNQGLVPTDVPPASQIFNVAALSYPLQTVSQGWDIFRGTCMSCHSLDANSTTSHAIGKKLTDNTFIQQSTDEQLLAFLKVGRASNDPANTTGNTMPAKGGNPALTDDDLRSVVAFVRELNKGTVNLNGGTQSDTRSVGNFEGVDYQWTPFASHFDSPIGMTFAPDHSGRLFVAEQMGQILIVDGKGQINPTPFLDITDLVPLHVYDGSYTEQGLLGLAFPPNFAQTGVFFVSYNDANVNSVIARYHVIANDPNRADPNSGVILLKFHQPYQEHKGGQIAFGPDGYLYAAFGDGGNPSLPSYRSQNPQSYLGKMLRLDVSDVNAPTYKIPPDNPYVGNPTYLPEIWALGLRNPWRWSFDRQTGDLFIGDVGQWQYESLDYQPHSSPGGENYRWSAFEGVHTYLKDQPVLGQATWPIVEYDHKQGQCIVGGYVYRGKALPGLVGKYIYGDYIYSKVWILDRGASGQWQNQVFMPNTGYHMSAFAEDADGELYLVDYKGTIYRLTQGPNSSSG